MLKKACQITFTILSAVAVLWLLEWSATPASTEQTTLESSEKQSDKPRLLLFWFDGLAERNMGDGPEMPKLKARFDRTLHGPVRCCADALSVPCFTSMVTGIDTFSLFGFMRNLGGTGSLPPGNLLTTLQERGLRLGFVGERLVGAVVKDFDWVQVYPDNNDMRNLREGMAALDRENLDIVIIFMGLGDQIAHVSGPKNAEYSQAMEAADNALDNVIRNKRPNDHVVFFGDHGHTEDGRHFTGLHVPTYAVFWGPTWSRPLRHPMAMTDYGSLWAPVFGLQWGNVAWVDRYFSGAEVSPPEKLPHLPSGRTGVSWLVALLALAVVVILVAGPFIRGPAMNRDHAVAFLALAAACILAGALYDKIWAFNYYRPRWFYTGFGLVWGAIAAALMFPLWRKKSPGALLLTGTVLFALPTVYKFGSTYASVSALLVVTIGYAIHSRQRATLLWTGAFVALAYTIWNPAVRNFAVRWFSFYSETLASWEVWAFAALLGGAVGAVWKRDPVWLLLCGAGAVVGSGMPFIPAWAYIVPCVLAFPMLMVAWRRPALEAHAVALGLWATPFAMSQTGGDIDLTILPPIAASVALFPLWARAAYKFPLWVRGASILTLSWLSLWTAMGCRLSGINFSFFFLWLPEGMSVEDTWLLNSLISLFKYWVPVGIGLILARRAQPEAVNDVIATIQQFATIKLGLVLAFIVGFSTFQAATAPPFLYSDVLTEAFIWMVLLLFFGCVGVGNIQKTSNNTGVSSP